MVVRQGSVDDITGRKERDRLEKNVIKSEVHYLVIVGIHDMTVRLEVLCLQIYVDIPVIDWREPQEFTYIQGTYIQK